MDPAVNDAATPTSPPRRKSAAWIWYFVLLAVLSLVASITMIVYNLRQQLTQEKLDQAAALWQQFGPKSYDFEFTKKIGSQEPELFKVRVRDGEVIEALRNGKPLEQRQYSEYSMFGVLGWLEAFLQYDAKPGQPRAFARGVFDPKDGHLRSYVRSVSSTRHRVEIVVTKFEAVSEEPRP